MTKGEVHTCNSNLHLKEDITKNLYDDIASQQEKRIIKIETKQELRLFQY